MTLVEELKLKSGTTYRNSLGAVIIVDGPWVPGPSARVKTLGHIYEARSVDSLFGDTHYLVTRQAMAECGYVEVDKP